jgi:hypothetical protein
MVMMWRSFNTWESTDPRDRIYALSSFASNMRNLFPIPKLFIKPDYSISVRDLFCSVVRADISSTKKLHALCLGHVINDERPRSDPRASGWVKTDSSGYDSLPSWVPNFSGSGMMANPHVYRYRQDKYRASGDTSASSVLVSESAEKCVKDSLCLRGIYLDDVSKLNPTITREHRKFEDLQALVRTVQTAENLNYRFWASGGGTVSFAYQDDCNSVGIDGIGKWLIPRPMAAKQGAPQTLTSDTATLLPHSPAEREKTSVINSDMAHQKYDLNLGHDFPSSMVCLSGYVFAVTVKGFKCMVPEDSMPGDAICILYGSPVPHVLRVEVNTIAPSDGIKGLTGTKYRLIGTAYVHDYMHGEALKEKESGTLREEDFLIV